ARADRSREWSRRPRPWAIVGEPPQSRRLLECAPFPEPAAHPVRPARWPDRLPQAALRCRCLWEADADHVGSCDFSCRTLQLSVVKPEFRPGRPRVSTGFFKVVDWDTA